MVFQSFNLFAHKTVLENVTLGPTKVRRESSSAAKERAQKLLDRVGVANQASKYPAQLSGGQQQRVAVARSLVNDPLMILADEPTGNLDSKTGTEVLDLIDKLNAAGKTIVLVTHDERVAARAHRVVHMKDGLIDREVINRPPPAPRAVPAGSVAQIASVVHA